METPFVPQVHHPHPSHAPSRNPSSRCPQHQRLAAWCNRRGKSTSCSSTINYAVSLCTEDIPLVAASHAVNRVPLSGAVHHRVSLVIRAEILLNATINTVGRPLGATKSRGKTHLNVRTNADRFRSLVPPHVPFRWHFPLGPSFSWLSVFPHARVMARNHLVRLSPLIVNAGVRL